MPSRATVAVSKAEEVILKYGTRNIGRAEFFRKAVISSISNNWQLKQIMGIDINITLSVNSLHCRVTLRFKQVEWLPYPITRRRSGVVAHGSRLTAHGSWLGDASDLSPARAYFGLSIGIASKLKYVSTLVSLL
jgi:hypothetical protein